MEDSSMVRIDRRLSIETEPRTLGFDQIQFAREAALYVVNTKNMDEAMHIFTEGLQPVVGGVKQNGDEMMNDQVNYSEDDHFGSPRPRPRPREVVSAPF